MSIKYTQTTKNIPLLIPLNELKIDHHFKTVGSVFLVNSPSRFKFKKTRPGSLTLAYDELVAKAAHTAPKGGLIDFFPRVCVS